MRFLNWISLPLSRPTFHKSRVVFVLSSFPNLQGLLLIKLRRTLLILSKNFDKNAAPLVLSMHFLTLFFIFLQNWDACLLQYSWFSLWSKYRLNLVFFARKLVLSFCGTGAIPPVHQCTPQDPVSKRVPVVTDLRRYAYQIIWSNWITYHFNLLWSL